MTVQLGRHRHDVGANYLGGMKDTSRRLLKNIQQTSDTFEIGFQGVVTESELFLKQAFGADSCGLSLLTRHGNVAKVRRLSKGLTEIQKSLLSQMGRRHKYADSGNYFLKRKKLCSVPAKSQICTGEREDRTFTSFDLLHLYC